MIRKIIRNLRVIKINVLVYKMTNYQPFNIPKCAHKIEKTRLKKKWRYSIGNSDKMMHQSFLFHRVYLMKSLKKQGPVIGGCFTHAQYRGKSLYPFVINRIAKDIIEIENKEVFIIVNQDNLNSIRGIEKAGFSKYATINAKRWLWFYLKKDINYFNNAI